MNISSEIAIVQCSMFNCHLWEQALSQRGEGSCREQRLYEIIRGEFDEIIHFFAHTDETNGNFQVFRDGCHNAAFCRTVEFRQYDSVHPRALREFACLCQAV